jgi:hypothetical protein
MSAHSGEREPLLVGNGQAFWGDTMSGPVRLVRDGPLHYLTLDYLAEVTMSILQKARQRDPTAGYATDFIRLLEQILPECHERGIRIVANAGGVNPRACAEAVMALAARLGCVGLRVGMVEGDDATAQIETLLAGGQALDDLDTGEALAPHLGRMQSANAYFGAWPIVEALQAGADIVVTGRCTDASLVVAPIAFEFGWSPEDLDLLAAATVAGHIIECGTQCTGGNFEGWRTITGWSTLGFPIVEAHRDGTFVVTKHPGTGGAVTTDTVTAQLLYEIADPRRYITADVVVDFTTLELNNDGLDRVRVHGVRGAPPTSTYKVSCTLRAGYKAVGQLTVPGPDAIDKARLAADIIFDRLAVGGVRFPAADHVVEMLGAGVCLAGSVGSEVTGTATASVTDPPEVVLRIAVRSNDRVAVDQFGAELASVLTSGPPGLTGFAGGRPKAGEILEHWSVLIDKTALSPAVEVFEVLDVLGPHDVVVGPEVAP